MFKSTELIRTDEVASVAELQEFYEETDLGDIIPVCAGEWRREGDGYAWWKNPAFDD